ncbi:MAG: glycosyltransferase [Deltaproteobacteria bacterium]|jgi:hypothetical protein|nr:glycosyltransferase [Deltaproteobacteria bacterium]
MKILNVDSTRLVPSFRELGHDVVTVGFSEGCDIVVTSPRKAQKLYEQVCSAGFVPDCLFWCDLSNLPYLPGIEELPCATVHYSIDTYCQIWHFGFANAFDAVFVAQKDHVPMFPHERVQVRWLPLCAPDSAELLPMGERDIPVSFVGTRKHPNNPDREGFLQGFRRAQPLFIHSGAYEDIFCRSKIALNQTACSEVNYRCFEAMSCGAALLMEHCHHGLEELFTPGVNILPLYVRNNWQQAAEIAAAALAEPERLAEIAANGRDLVMRQHLARHRAVEVVNTLESLLREEASKQRLEQLDTRRAFIASSYDMLGIELTGRLSDVYSEYYFSLAGRTKE